MIDLDLSENFSRAAHAALTLGVVGANVFGQRMNVDALMLRLAAQLGAPLKYRRFHMECLNRAYGIPFTAARKTRAAKKLGITQPVIERETATA